MVADKKKKNSGDMELEWVGHGGQQKRKENKVADMELDMVTDIEIDIEIQFGERIGHGGL